MTLNEQYQSVFSRPDPKMQIPDNYLDSTEDSPAEDKIIEDVEFDEEDIKKAALSTASVSSGPSGVSPLLVGKTINILKHYLYLLFRRIIDRREIPHLT